MIEENSQRMSKAIFQQDLLRYKAPDIHMMAGLPKEWGGGIGG